MKLYEILRELRRNPELNTAKQGHDAAIEFLKKIPENELENYGVSMTEIPKLGINPQSKYNTPLGVYFYPADHYLMLKSEKKPLEFQDTAPYIQILKLNGKILFLNEYDDSNLDQDLATLKSHADELGRLTEMSGPDVLKRFINLEKNSGKFAKNTTPGGKIWWVTWRLSAVSGTEKRPNAPTRASVVWNKIFRLMGYGAAIDKGASIIHENEPAQGVILNPTSFKLIKTFENKTQQSNAAPQHPSVTMLQYQASDPKKYVQYVLNQMISMYPEDVKGYEGIMKKVAEKVAQNLNNDPTAYNEMSQGDLSRLKRLADGDKTLLEIFTVGFYKQKFLNLKDQLKSLKDLEKINIDANGKSLLMQSFLKQFLPIYNELKVYSHNQEAEIIVAIIEHFINLNEKIKNKISQPLTQPQST